jgi:hypothetical protein
LAVHADARQKEKHPPASHILVKLDSNVCFANCIQVYMSFGVQTDQNLTQGRCREFPTIFDTTCFSLIKDFVHETDFPYFVIKYM